MWKPNYVTVDEAKEYLRIPTTDTAARAVMSRVARFWLSNCPPYSTK